MIKSPFKFLDSYTKDDREIFFGREREIEELYHRVFESKIMLVYGVSGTGKSSLIHCGLANKFQETDWLPLNIRRGGNILESFASAVKNASITPQTGEIITPSQFKKSVRSLYLDHYKPVFFIFDQFEELFIFGNKDEKRSFIQVIKTLLDSDLQCRFIFVMREEYMANITEFEKFIPTIFSNRVRIEKMSHLNAIEAIKGPCRVAGIEVEEGFADTLLEKLSPGSIDVELTYLQVFLDRILRLATTITPPSELAPSLPRRGAGGVAKPSRDSISWAGGVDDPNRKALQREVQEGCSFTLSLLSRVGNVSDLLGSFLDEQIALMEEPETGMTVLKAFVSDKGTKRPASEAETIDNVRSLGKEVSQEKVNELLQTFVRLRVLRDKDDRGRYELRHDSLAEKIFEKFSTAEKELLEIRQFIENAYQSFVKRKILLSNDDLVYISNKDSLLNLNLSLKEFIEASRKHQKAIIRTVRRLTAVSFLSFLIMMGIVGYFTLTKISQTKADYGAIKLMTSSTDKLERLKMASDLWKNTPGAIQKELLIKAFNNILESPGADSLMLSIARQYNILFDETPVKIQYITCSKDNKYFFGYGDSLIFIWSIRGRLENTIRTEHFPIIDLKMSENSQLIGAAGSDSILTIWNINGKKQFAVKVQYNNVNTKQIFKFTRENNVVSLFKGCDAVLLNHEGKILQTFNRHTDRVNAVDISPDNNFIATASSDSTIKIWYYNTIKQKYDFYNTLSRHRDTVWSVSFAKNNVNVISTSSDNNFRIVNINNEKIYNAMLLYKYRSLMSCYAEFTASGKGIIIISHSYKNIEINNMYYAINWNNPKIYINNREGEDIFYFPSKFSKLTFSEDEDYYACSEKDKVYLVDNRLGLERSRLEIRSTYTLLSLSGTNPFFTPDSKYFIFADGKKIRAFFVNIKTISNIADNIKK